MRAVTRDILLASNPGERSPESVDLTSWLRELVTEVRGILPKRVKLTVDVPPARKNRRSVG